ncbi:MAG: hypothetical protein K6B74_13520 [Ruminococcus sp.]|nr:hypothetical protein [Ruminococcus sp.]
MARKADIKNLIKEAERKDQRVIEIEKMLEAAKNDSVGAWDKVSVRRNEMEQETNKALAAVDREVFWNDITPEELRMKWDELLLINEVKDYIESERAKHNVGSDKVSDETNNIYSDVITDTDRSADKTATV